MGAAAPIPTEKNRHSRDMAPSGLMASLKGYGPLMVNGFTAHCSWFSRFEWLHGARLTWLSHNFWLARLYGSSPLTWLAHLHWLSRTHWLRLSGGFNPIARSLQMVLSIAMARSPSLVLSLLMASSYHMVLSQHMAAPRVQSPAHFGWSSRQHWLAPMLWFSLIIWL